ncbi:AtzE family amidohydrolase [Phreatobacter stygius]|uniref:AtzE family amidohydrolase n=1 Tax=Phreatobacter stygius TaxID=1940610 RepID=A0A4D7B6I6_9HYPH|nr:AtzE family amidohydrolase [Phreatobacter stygius]QCI63792.1 AtzE family amidohydrolase [Phreatobacter stygius]
MTSDVTSLTATDISAGIRDGRFTARAVTEAHLARIATHDAALGAFTAVTRDRALAEADAVDQARAKGLPLGPLAGVPFAVKNLYDIKGIATLAGSRINRDHAPATRDAALISRLNAGGGVLLGALNMGEYAYDFTGENAHDGPSRNPHDLRRMSGGSSGGSGTAAAAGLAPVTLGSDTNGSIRVPASLCGLFGLKPTYGRLSKAGTFPFVASFDHLGPLARSTADCAAFYDAMAGHDPDDPVCRDHQAEALVPMLGRGIGQLRIARAAGYFDRYADRQALAATERVARVLGAAPGLEIPDVAEARAAAYVITNSEGGSFHLDRLKTRPRDFDPETRDRFIAGALLPAAYVNKAQRVRGRYRAAMLRLFQDIDVIIAPATPTQAPSLGQKTFELGGATLPVRASLGLFTQPFSFIGLPVMSVPVWLDGETLPIGVQVIAAPWREDIVVRVSAALERDGVVASKVASLKEPA